MKRLVLLVTVIVFASSNLGCGLLGRHGGACGCGGWSCATPAAPTVCNHCSTGAQDVGFASWGGELIHGGIPTSTSFAAGCPNCGVAGPISGGVISGEVISEGLLDGGATTQPVLPTPSPN